MNTDKDETTISAEDLRTITSTDVKIGGIAKLIKGLAEMGEAGPGIDAGDGQAILDYVTDPESAVLTVTIDNGVASLSIHESFIEVLSDNGLLEVFT